MKDPVFVAVQEAMQKLAKQLRSSAYWCHDDYYDDDARRGANEAKRTVLEEVASSIDTAFDVDSTLTSEDTKRKW